MSSPALQLTPPAPHPTSDAVMMEAPDSPPFNPTQGASVPMLKPTLSNTGASRGNGDGLQTKQNFGIPGSSYSSKKFHEDYERANLNVIDKDWDPSKYGDPVMSG